MAYNPVRQPCIYVVAEDGTPDVAKIGVTEGVARRLGSMQSHNWRKLSIAAAYRVPEIDLAHDIESDLLDTFRRVDLIIRGEWVRLSPAALMARIEDYLTEIDIPVVHLIGGNQGDVIKLWSNQR